MTESNTQANRLVLYFIIGRIYNDRTKEFHGRAVINRLTGDTAFEVKDTDAVGVERWSMAHDGDRHLIQQATHRLLALGWGYKDQGGAAARYVAGPDDDHRWALLP